VFSAVLFRIRIARFMGIRLSEISFCYGAEEEKLLNWALRTRDIGTFPVDPENISVLEGGSEIGRAHV
jgi:hypothetical protein